jgi:hypothetical protein
LLTALRKGWYQLSLKDTTLDWWRQRAGTIFVSELPRVSGNELLFFCEEGKVLVDRSVLA